MSTYPPIKLYRHITGPKGQETGEILAKFRVYLKDRPGSLAAFSSMIAGSGGNISFFHYDRSSDGNRVVVEVKLPLKKNLMKLLTSLKEKKYHFEQPETSTDEINITAIENILEIKVRLENEPGTLAAFARLLKRHRANVIYMFYDEDIDAESAVLAMAVEDAAEINRLLDAINKQGYLYRVIYRGADTKEMGHVIGLKLTEKFFLRLRKVLSDSDIGEVKALVGSSQELSEDLISFYSEAGENLESIDVFEKVLALASASRSKTGKEFSFKGMPQMTFGNVKLYGFRMPTSENIYVLDDSNDLTMIDTGYGIYYKDVKKLMEGMSLSPSRLKRLFITHADADHAGASGYFESEFHTKVFIHPAARGVIDNDSRNYGLTGRLSKLNQYYTRLVNRFTECRFPEKAEYFEITPKGKRSGFNIIDRFSIGSLDFEVLESKGGHIPGNVFFLNTEYGLLFTADYLLNVESLTAEDKNTLNVYKYLLISPNHDSGIFKEEMQGLRGLLLGLEGDLKKKGRRAMIFPGHGDYYALG